MAVPLAAIAVGAGVARTVGGIFGANKKKKVNRDLIKRAYQVGKRNLNARQGDIRQSTHERLNARGVFSPGSSSTQLPLIREAYAAGAGKTKGEGWEQARMAGDATRGGGTVAGNTLAGGVDAGLSEEFLREHQDLWEHRRAGLAQSSAEHFNDIINAAGAGVDMATGVYRIGSAWQDRKKPPAPGGGSQPAPVSIRGAFGIDPVDPLRLSKPGAMANYNNTVRRWDR